MNPRNWLWVGTVIDLIVFFPASYLAVGALQIYQQSDRSAEITGVLLLFFALPVFCIAAPLAAWRALRRGRSPAHIGGLFVAPLVYAAFLVAFLMQGA